MGVVLPYANNRWAAKKMVKEYGDDRRAEGSATAAVECPK